MTENYSWVELPGSGSWISSYEAGEILDKMFPEQDAHNFCMACEHNGHGPLETGTLAGLVLIEQGENDEAPWLWEVTVDDTVWLASGSCDYTGWDCQSSLEWSIKQLPGWLTELGENENKN